MKKVVSVSLSLILSLSLLAACGKAADTKQGGSATTTAAATTAPAASATAAPKAESSIKGKITFLTNRTDMIDKEYKDYAARFKQKYPDADVEFEALTDYDKNLKIRMASGEMPDVVLIPSIPNTDLPKYFAPLDDLGLNDKIYFKDYKTQDGKLYGITAGSSTVGIVYNKKAFATAGITSVPKTLDEFYTDSDKLKAKGIVPLASNFKDKWPLGYWGQQVPIMLAGSATVGNDRMKSDTPYTLDGPYGKSMGILKTMYQKGYLEKDINSTNWEQSKKDVASGKFAMYLIGNWVINQVIENGAKSEDIGFFPFPKDNSGKLNATLDPDWFYAVNGNSKNVETAKAFVKWMIEDSGYDKFAGFIPVLKVNKPDMPQLVEFNSYNPTYIEAVADDDKAIQVQNKAQIDQSSIVQEFVLGDPKAIFDKYNKQWADAKKQLGF